jgi:hypothetical protein
MDAIADMRIGSVSENADNIVGPLRFLDTVKDLPGVEELIQAINDLSIDSQAKAELDIDDINKRNSIIVGCK